MSRKSEISEVKALGERIGYGNLMDIASALWANKVGHPMHIPSVEGYMTDEGKEVAHCGINARLEELKRLGFSKGVDMYTDAKLHGEKVREKMLSFIVKYIEEHQYSPTVKEIGHGVGLKSNSSVVSHLIRLREEGKINYIDYQPRTITVPGYKFVKEMRKAMYFDNYVSKCPYFNGNTNLNNGYGCNHELQEEKENGQGKCFCWSCPCGYPADEESLQENDIEWEDGKPESDSMEEDSYIILN